MIKVINMKMSRDNNMKSDINLLLSKYNGSNSMDNSIDKPIDMSANSILIRENIHLTNIIKSQKQIIDSFQTKFQDLSIQYNNKIEKLRDIHLQELNELHQQFKSRLKRDNANIK
jgi:hypothetical protein